MKKFLLCLSILLIFPEGIHAAANSGNPSPPKSPRQIANGDALALYPAEIRDAVLTALQYPQTLQQISDLQKKSSAAFQQLIAPLPRKTQEEVWEMVKYPKLLDDLSVGEKINLKDYSKDVQSMALDLFKREPDLLTKVSKLDDQPIRDFQAVIQKLPPQGQSAFQKLLQNSDILLALGENLNLRNNPSASQLNASIQKLSTQLRQANSPTPDKLAVAQGDDPKAVATLQKAENQFNKDLNYQNTQEPYPAGAAQMNVNFDPYPFATGVPGFYNYPYWFGWPSWFW